MSLLNLEELRAVDIRTVKPENLVDITQIHIDENLEGKGRGIYSTGKKSILLYGGKNDCKVKLFREFYPYLAFSGISSRSLIFEKGVEKIQKLC